MRLAAAALALGIATGDLAARPAPVTCRVELGARRAADLLRQCRDVSPGARTCAEAASCTALEEEIRRSCRLAGEDAPNVCGLYLDEEEDEDDG